MHIIWACLSLAMPLMIFKFLLKIYTFSSNFAHFFGGDIMCFFHIMGL